jgi:hypothetical protein
MTSFARVRSSRQIRAFYHCELERPIECTPFTGTEQASRIPIEVVSGLPTIRESCLIAVLPTRCTSAESGLVHCED